VVVSHDRYFLDNVVTTWPKSTAVYPEGHPSALEGGYSPLSSNQGRVFCCAIQPQESLANKVRREVEWLRRGPKARTRQIARPHQRGPGRLIRELSDLRIAFREGAWRRSISTATERRTSASLRSRTFPRSLGGRTSLAA